MIEFCMSRSIRIKRVTDDLYVINDYEDKNLKQLLSLYYFFCF